MRLEDGYDEYEYEQPSKSGKLLTKIGVGIVMGMILIASLVVAVNYGKSRGMKARKAGEELKADKGITDAEAQAVHESVQQLIDADGITSDQLDFWETYKDYENVTEEKQPEKETDGSDKLNNSVSGNTSSSEDGLTDAEVDHVNQTMIKMPDGTEKWVRISPFITKNKYNPEGFSYQDSIMKYYVNGKDISHLGVDISKEDGEVNFSRLKKAGIEFVMIQVGARGYGSGKLNLDENFADNIQGATEAGLNIGVSFFSQAITKDEALEEANLVYENIKDYELSYPIAFDMEKITGDTARIDFLSKEEKSNIALAFLQALKDVGYKGIVYGDKEWLIEEINLSMVSSFDIWLSQDGQKPDYPYKFSIWQYTKTGKIDGITGDARMDICFIDYEMK